MKVINLTPHSINLMPEGVGGPVMTIHPSGQVARCVVSRRQVDTIIVDGLPVPVNRTQLGEVVGLPDPQDDTVYVVSSLVAQAVPDRADVLIVDDAVRDDMGNVIGAKALAHV